MAVDEAGDATFHDVSQGSSCRSYNADPSRQRAGHLRAFLVSREMVKYYPLYMFRCIISIFHGGLLSRRLL